MQIFAKTDIGRERNINEDCYYISAENSKIQLFIIADGMGGYNAGEVASKMAIEKVKEYIENKYKENEENEEFIKQIIRDAIEYANNTIYEYSKTKKELDGMGTTLDVCLIYNNKVYIGHIGDSRVYRIRKNFLRKITKDHSYVQTLVEDGKITKEEAYNHPKKNMLTKALGCLEMVEPDICAKTFLPGDMIIMTTDGLTNMLRDNEIYQLIKQNPQKATENLINEANLRGGYDNITVIIINKERSL